MAEAADNPGWATVSELARLRGVDKAAISRRAKRLEAQGLLHPRPGAHGTKLISIAEFDRAAGEATDAVRELNGRGAATPAAADSTLAYQQRRRAAASADMAEIERDKQLEKLAPVETFAAGAFTHGAALARRIDQIAERADDLAAIVAKDGVAGLRAALRALARDLRDGLSHAFAELAELPPNATEPLVAEAADAA